LYEIIAFHTNQPVEKVAVDCDRDKWLTSTEAKEYGLIDEVLIMNMKKQKKDQK
jgi:ATP-dependent Clp protease protease subunit